MGDNGGTEDSEQPSPARREASSGRSHWMMRYPFFAAIIVAVIGGVIVLVPDKAFDAFSGGDSSSATPTSGKQPPRSETTAGDGSPSASAPAAPSPTAGDIRWSGTINLTYVDLDSVPPRVLRSNTGASVWVSYARKSLGGFSAATLYGLRGGSFTTNPTIALWNGPAKPTRLECSNLISTQGAENLPVSADNSYCVKTAANRVAFVTELSLDNVGDAYKALVTVWAATK
ncbi:hypothetical protein AB4305_11340 [Nocardia sp. 2YAB30]|uniref:hypothetical protein n=1 Tax=unclassified Nocardia TaxID=2637762 RepID=UPI003F9BDD6E